MRDVPLLESGCNKKYFSLLLYLQLVIIIFLSSSLIETKIKCKISSTGLLDEVVMVSSQENLVVSRPVSPHRRLTWETVGTHYIQRRKE